MAVLDVVTFVGVAVANGSFLAFQPGAGEIVIHNVIVPFDKAVEYEVYDGTNLIKFDDDTTYGSRLRVNWHCTNTKYYRVKNVSGGAINLWADGVVTK